MKYLHEEMKQEGLFGLGQVYASTVFRTEIKSYKLVESHALFNMFKEKRLDYTWYYIVEVPSSDKTTKRSLEALHLP